MDAIVVDQSLLFEQYRVRSQRVPSQRPVNYGRACPSRQGQPLQRRWRRVSGRQGRSTNREPAMRGITKQCPQRESNTHKKRAIKALSWSCLTPRGVDDFIDFCCRITLGAVVAFFALGYIARFVLWITSWSGCLAGPLTMCKARRPPGWRGARLPLRLTGVPRPRGDEPF